MSLKDALLPIVDRLRGIPGDLGLRLFSVQIVKRTWVGVRAGLGAAYDSTNSLKVDLGTYQVKVRQVSSKDIIASGGLYSEEDLEVGPLTPAWDEGGTEVSDFDPVKANQPTEVFFKISGPGYGSGAWFKKVSQNTSKPFRYTFVVRKTAEISDL